MGTILIVTDADSLATELTSALADTETQVDRISEGRDLVPALAASDYDLVILDLQVGSMGGLAATLAVRNEESGGRLRPTRILLLLDRDADRYLAAQSGADGWLVKPFDSLDLREAADRVRTAPV